VLLKEVQYIQLKKPVELLEYLVKTYTDENMTTLDCTMGSGSTGVACINTNRKFIGIEMDDKYFDIGSKRILESNKDE
jgi:DNA modification methylase